MENVNEYMNMYYVSDGTVLWLWYDSHKLHNLQQTILIFRSDRISSVYIVGWLLLVGW